jgi:kynureninase
MSTLHPSGPADAVDDGGFRPDEAFARRLDDEDPLRSYRERFEIPTRDGGTPVVYLVGNSLGLQPRTTRAFVEQELDDWARLAVDAHFQGRTPWFSYHEVFRESGARLVGAEPGEVVMMNSLTVNLHLMLVSFFRPTPERHRILIEWPVFPSDLYMVQTHLRTRGLDPAESLVVVEPRAGEHVVRTEDLEAAMADPERPVAAALLAGVNYRTGQVLDMARLAACGHEHGCMVGFDLAHAAGNVELRLHDWDVDFAAWCSYKYLNAGPGAVAGCFVHARHAADVDLPRYGGWWGNDPATRFQMHEETEFRAKPDADGWQLSNPSIMAMAPLRASLEIFDEAGMPALRAKSLRLTGYLRFLLERRLPESVEILTPRDPAAHGCQLSFLVHDRPRERFDALQKAGMVCDFREPNIVRAAPVPLYNSFHDVWRFAETLVR